MSAAGLKSLVAVGLALGACGNSDRNLGPDEKLALTVERIHASDGAMLFVEGDPQTLEKVERHAVKHGWKFERQDGQASISFGSDRTNPEISVFLKQLFQNEFGPVQRSSVAVLELPMNSALQKNK
ncbi:hypothetical protein [Sphingosinicella soli]|uniref:Lipoprotein n=1 Tax=Sphingosinicella soli TaxID=333708 RepID=A0A7W7AYC9_9SPHN|nr:hypothetical protein [Sphingosinicella soli]MBB4630509.1 hypothetical protein [Sphingosinicella soli]